MGSWHKNNRRDCTILFEEGFTGKFVEKMDINWEQNQWVAEDYHLTLSNNPLQSNLDVWSLNDIKPQANFIEKAFIKVRHHCNDNILVMINELE